MIRATLALVLMAGTAMAQGLPQFDDTLGYDVIGTADEGLILKNDGTTFYCEVDDAEGETYLYFEVCLPILGPSAVQAYQKTRLESSANEADLLAALESMPTIAFMPAIEQAIRDDYACVVPTGGDDEDAFLRALAERVADQVGYTGRLSAEAVDEIGEITEDAATTMIDQGRIVLDREARVARLADCP